MSRGQQLRTETSYNTSSSVPLSSTRARCNTRSLTAAAASTTTRSTPQGNDSHNTTTLSSDHRTADRYVQLFIPALYSGFGSGFR